MRPLLFLDVDGPLIPFGGSAQDYPVFGDVGRSPGEEEDSLLARLDPGLGPRLAELGCTLVWATSWEEAANHYVAPRLGLPALPVVEWPEPSDLDDDDALAGRHWKTRALVAWAAARAFAWVDDEITAADRSWVAAHHPGEALLHRVDPRRGLTAADFAILGDWAAALGAGSALRTVWPRPGA
jgi:hypothetical protein